MKKFLFYDTIEGHCYYAVAQKLEYAYDIICNTFGTEYTARAITYEGEINNG